MRILFVLVVVSVLSIVTSSTTFATEREADLLIVGGTESGWAAAIQAARMNVERIVIAHDGSWLGGQYTEQALVCVDENKGPGKVGWGVDWHPMKRSFHRFGLFKELMDRIEAFNTGKYGHPMPGFPYHGPSTFRPAEAEMIFHEMLAPHVETGQVSLLMNRIPVEAIMEGDRLTGMRFKSTRPDEGDVIIRARMTIDASDWGDAVQLSGAAYEVGADPQSRYNEPSAPVDLSDNPPNEMNPITWAMIVEQSEGPSPIAKPDRYDERNYVRTSRFAAKEFAGLKWDRPVTKMGGILHWPDAGEASPRQLSVYNVRRAVDGYRSKEGQTVILLNFMLGQDYPLERLPAPVVEALEATEPGASMKNIVEMTREQREIIFADARRHSLGVLYHLQNYAHERATDKTHSFRNFRLSGEFPTDDYLPPKPYIRESLRLKALYMMREQDGRNFDAPDKKGAREAFARVMYPDGLFSWQFHYDFHRTGRTYLRDEGNTGPWIDYEKPGRHTRFLSDRSVFPMRSLIPVKVDGLIGAQKNVGYSSIVSAAIRLHDQCVHLGQAAGAVAAESLERGVQPRELAYDRNAIEDIRDGLCGGSRGVPMLLWPFRDLPADHPAFVAVNRLAAMGVFPMDRRSIDFRPEAPASEDWKRSVIFHTFKHIKPISILSPSDVGKTRGEFAIRWWQIVEKLSLKEFDIQDPTDADLDGIPDFDDALPYNATNLSWPAEQCLRWNETPKGPEFDGLIDGGPGKGVRRFNFAGKSIPDAEGFTHDDGSAYNQKRGFGWVKSVSGNARQRGAAKEAYRDTFLFTRSRDTWECEVPNGRYRVTVCVGDSGHEQSNQTVRVEGSLVIDDEHTFAGSFLERTSTEQVSDGRLTVEIGNGKPNTCLNWLEIASE